MTDIGGKWLNLSKGTAYICAHIAYFVLAAIPKIFPSNVETNLKTKKELFIRHS
jgi:hypothetical protein